MMWNAVEWHVRGSNCCVFPSGIRTFNDDSQFVTDFVLVQRFEVNGAEANVLLRHLQAVSAKHVTT